MRVRGRRSGCVVGRARDALSGSQRALHARGYLRIAAVGHGRDDRLLDGRRDRLGDEARLVDLGARAVARFGHGGARLFFAATALFVKAAATLLFFEAAALLFFGATARFFLGATARFFLAAAALLFFGAATLLVGDAGALASEVRFAGCLGRLLACELGRLFGPLERGARRLQVRLGVVGGVRLGDGLGREAGFARLLCGGAGGGDGVGARLERGLVRGVGGGLAGAGDVLLRALGGLVHATGEHLGLAEHAGEGLGGGGGGATERERLLNRFARERGGVDGLLAGDAGHVGALGGGVGGERLGGLAREELARGRVAVGFGGVALCGGDERHGLVDVRGDDLLAALGDGLLGAGGRGAALFAGGLGGGDGEDERAALGVAGLLLGLNGALEVGEERGRP